MLRADVVTNKNIKISILPMIGFWQTRQLHDIGILLLLYSMASSKSAVYVAVAFGSFSNSAKLQ